MKSSVCKSLFTILFIILLACNNGNREDVSLPKTETFSEIWKYHAGEGNDSTWTDIHYNDSGWISVVSTKTLKEQGIATDNGFGWYRKYIQLSDSLVSGLDAKGALVIRLGKMAACDEVYLNGKLIGKTGKFPHDYMGSFDNERNYIVYKDDWNLKGDNLISIKFHDGWGQNGGFISNNLLTISTAETKDKIDMQVEVADEDYIFTGNNPIKIEVKINNNNKWDIEGNLIVKLETDDFQHVKLDSLFTIIKGTKIFTHTFTFDNPIPGFYRYTLQYKRNGEIVSEKKFNVGYEPEKIQSPIDAKNDFKEFWNNNLLELKKVAPQYKLTLIPEASKLDYDMYLVQMRSFGNELIQGYYAKPKKEGVHPVIVEYMGYGSKPYYPNQTWDGFAYFVLSIRGQVLNEDTNRFGKWITYGLNNKNEYYYRGAFLDVVRAIDFVCSRSEIDSSKIAVRGASQGGALSFVAASLDKRVKVAAPTIPFLSDFHDYFKIVSWPKNDFDEYMKNNPQAKWNDIYNLLTYFDIKNLAQSIECPLIMGIGVQDEVCPPHINFAAYNQVKAEKRWMAFPLYGHSVGREFQEASMALFKEKLNIK